MRILFVWPSADFSVSDVARGYRAAFIRQGHEIRDYELARRILYHRRAVGEAFREDPRAVSKQACETILVEAIYHRADLVVIVAGLYFHPVGLQLLRWGGFRTAAFFTESPYEDENQVEWCAHDPEMTVFTHEEMSAVRYGWRYLPHAFDPAIHHPRQPSPAEACDVLMIGTGWPERQQFLEAVDWMGIRLVIRGLWSGISPASPLYPFYREGCIDNAQVPALYASAAICLNFHRAHPDAVSLNPRAYELAACGAFQVSDWRRDVDRVFGGAVPTFETPQQLEQQIRRYLAQPAERQRLAAEARARVSRDTFDERAAVLMAALRESAAVAATTR